jgi:hypothetical protein
LRTFGEKVCGKKWEKVEGKKVGGKKWKEKVGGKKWKEKSGWEKVGGVPYAN